MTDPLIDRDGLLDVIADAPVDALIADTVLAYLRSVLTPEALNPIEPWKPATDDMVAYEARMLDEIVGAVPPPMLFVAVWLDNRERRLRERGEW